VDKQYRCPPRRRLRRSPLRCVNAAPISGDGGAGLYMSPAAPITAATVAHMNDALKSVNRAMKTLGAASAAAERVRQRQPPFRDRHGDVYSRYPRKWCSKCDWMRISHYELHFEHHFLGDRLCSARALARRFHFAPQFQFQERLRRRPALARVVAPRPGVRGGWFREHVIRWV